MKPTSHYLIFLSIVLLPALVAAQPPAPQDVSLTVNGRPIDVEEPALLLEDNLFIAATVLTSELGVQVGNEKGLWRLQSYGQDLQLRPGERVARVNGAEVNIALASIQRGEQLFVPVQLLREPLGLSVAHEGSKWHVNSPTAQLVQVRQGAHPDRVRFVFDLAGPASYRLYEEPGKVVLELPVSADQPELLRLHQFEDPLAEQVTESVQGGFVRLVISHESPEPPQLFTLTDPARLVVDLLREPAQCPVVQKPEVVRPTPGDIWDVCQFTSARGPVRGFVIRFNPATTAWRLRPALAGSTIMQRSTVSRISVRNNAYAALNGGFFASQGPPLGMLVIDGEWIKAPLYSRAVLGITRDGKYHIANVDFDGRAEFEGLGMLPVDRINEGHVLDDTVVAYTSRWGPIVVGAPAKTRLAINAQGVVAATYPPNVDAPMPKGGFVLSGNGHRATTLGGICQGTKVKLCLETTPRWPDLWQAIGGGPLLVDNGRVYVNGYAERFRSDVTNGSRPRSAVGLTAKGEVVLVAVQEPGMTLRELASVMVKLGATNAMNLDGGGSTAMVVNGRLLNIPGDGCERAVSNALLVVKS